MLDLLTAFTHHHTTLIHGSYILSNVVGKFDEMEHRYLQLDLVSQRTDMLAVAVQWKKQS